ncbi:MAG: prolyl oligopeptidase family serine peptidase [Verrucomicrobia bacterium]|jgi:predicted peptidase|nr:prolyl oligopeptidase family serine peptidase [Verrucomicrobiota bacterium]
MHSLRFVSLLLVTVLATGALSQPSPSHGVQTAKRYSKRISHTVAFDYLLHLPRDYRANARREWPLILFLHGAGERGTNVWLVAKHGPPKIVTTRPDFPFIVVSPQCPEGQTWSNEALLALLADVTKRYRVDASRVYLTGLSMGGYGTWSLGLSHPEKFAAIAPICGGGDVLKILLPEPGRAAALKSLPVWAFHGAKDPVVKLVESERIVNALKQAGATDVQLTVYPDADHDSWTATYENPQFYEWLLSHRRPVTPPRKR